MAKIAQLVEGNYNILDNIPVINQDLSASGFTPVANTYYRHTGATTDTFTQGVIYLYDTAYHKLGESGGTKLNRYELTINVIDLRIRALLLYNIYTQAKGRVSMCSYRFINKSDFEYVEYTPYYIDASGGRFFQIMGSNGGIYISAYSNSYGTAKRDYANINIQSKTIDSASTENWDGTVKVIYYNDTEIK